ncbi:uncharacterized protein FIESC28_09793 [Fusarium coffeatum]|uniref:Uncharacterized protein n=1 Tax=Fusarium coffeatum TaxID=231269 RepID=A0A366QXI5_9HYPO|nr:uncharacterized protein FIESC28_09793 [Fusarium coffeatum]RBR09603.1 hypothetical protein FIESC28_09793 [Fusarium coffeatum]
MGRPKPRRALSASRFQEGSMNDRTSAAPPVQFLGPEELAALERPALTHIKSNTARPMSDDFSDKQVKKGRLLGQVWDEVRGRLGFRRDNEDDKGSRKRSRSRKRDQDDQRGREREREDVQMTDMPDMKTAIDPPRDDMPSREEILANYHHLMASGFFSSHAIQSTRQPPPGSVQQAAQQCAAPPANLMDALSRAPTPGGSVPPVPTHKPPTPPGEPKSPSKARFPLKLQSPPGNPGAATYDELVASGFFTPPLSAGTSPPPTPFGAAPAPAVPTGIMSRDYLQPPRQTRGSRTGTPSTSCAASPIQSPASVSSRGTKRAAADSNSDDEAEGGARDPPTPKKKLRKSSSRDIGLPSLRNVASRRSLLSSRRSVSGPHGSGAGKDYNNLARRVLGRLPRAGGRSSFDSERGPASRPGSAARNSTDESRSPLQEVQYSRVLRSRKISVEEPHGVPGVHRGIPMVPDIPEKFALHNNAENMAPALRSRY